MKFAFDLPMNKIFLLTMTILVVEGFLNKSLAITFSQDYVLKKALSSSPHIKKIQLKKSQALSLLLEQEYSLYNWKTFSTLGKVRRKNPPISPFDSLRENNKTFTFGFEKRLFYGLSLGAIYTDFIQNRINSDFLKRVQAPQDIYKNQFSMELNMDLLRNILGYEERMAFNIIKAGKDKTNWNYFEAAERFALEAAGRYWSAYIAKTIHSQTQKGLKTYNQLVKEIENKKKYSFLRPGERPQVLAEYENVKQEVSKRKQDYLESLDELSLILKITIQPEEVVFQKEILHPYRFPESWSIENLRPIKILKKQIKEQNLQVQLAQSQLLPSLRFQGKAGQLAGKSGSRGDIQLFSSPYNFYEVSLNFLYSPFSKSQREKIKREKFKLEEQKIDLSLLKLEVENQVKSLKRKIQIGYQNILSAEKSARYQEEAFRELKTSFFQGRVDIFELITAENKLRESEIKKMIFLSEYFLLTLQVEALLDRLVERNLSL